MKQIKLPRKRKKAYIKAFGRSNYIGLLYVGEVIREDRIDDGRPLLKKHFPEYKKDSVFIGRPKLLKYW